MWWLGAPGSEHGKAVASRHHTPCAAVPKSACLGICPLPPPESIDVAATGLGAGERLRWQAADGTVHLQSHATLTAGCVSVNGTLPSAARDRSAKADAQLECTGAGWGWR